MRYFYHPESECLWTQADDEPVDTDGLAEELTEEEYFDLSDELGTE